MNMHGYGSKVYPTRYPELSFRRTGPGNVWRFVDTSTGSVVGPYYRSKAELLADLQRYGNEFTGVSK